MNGDGRITPLDVLETINYINTHPRQTWLPAQPFAPPRFFDVNGDGTITPGDVLVLLNYLNLVSATAGEGETSGAAEELVACFPVEGADTSVGLPPGTSSGLSSRLESAPSALETELACTVNWTLGVAERAAPPLPKRDRSSLADWLLRELEEVLNEILLAPT